MSYVDVRGCDDVGVDAFQFSGTVEAPRLWNDLVKPKIYYPILFEAYRLDSFEINFPQKMDSDLVEVR